jgi:hypothetical protein
MLLANPQFADDLILLYIKLKDNFDILIIIKKKKNMVAADLCLCQHIEVAHGSAWL